MSCGDACSEEKYSKKRSRSVTSRGEENFLFQGDEKVTLRAVNDQLLWLSGGRAFQAICKGPESGPCLFCSKKSKKDNKGWQNEGDGKGLEKRSESYGGWRNLEGLLRLCRVVERLSF